jgi:uncharacterized protein YqhQ
MINLNKSIDIKRDDFTYVLVSFTIQFIILNTLNILFGYYVLIPFIDSKYSKVFRNLIKLIKYGNFKSKEDKQRDKDKIKASHKEFMVSAFKFFKVVLFFLLVFNVFVFVKNPSNFMKNLVSCFTFKSIITNLGITGIILILQLIYFNHFTFPYYINTITKYLL